MQLNDVQVNLKDLRHPLGALNYIEYLQTMARGAVKRFKGLPEMMAFVALTRDLKTGLDLPHVGLSVITSSDVGLGDSGREKRIFSEIVKKIAHRGQAVLICFLSEAWTINSKADVEESVMRYWMASDDISECPFRQECVMLQTEHKAMDPRNQIWIAPITLVGEERTVGEFVNSRNSDSARFANLLPR